MTACLVLGLLATPSASSGATSSYPPLARVAVASDTYSGVAGVAASSADSRAQGTDARVTAPEQCPDAKKAVAFYSAKLSSWRVKMGAGHAAQWSGGRSTGPHPGASDHSCPHVRRLAHALQRKAHQARQRYLDWYFREYRWDHWLPAKWYRIARCETGVRWDWNSGAYQGAFGFATSSWDRFRLAGYPSEAYLATPRQQYEVALAIWRRYGFSGWGCRNA